MAGLEFPAGSLGVNLHDWLPLLSVSLDVPIRLRAIISADGDMLGTICETGKCLGVSL